MSCQSKLDWFWIYIGSSFLYYNNLNEWGWSGDLFNDPLDLYVWVYFLRIYVSFWTFKRDILLVWPFFFFFLHCHMCFEKKTLVIFVSMLPWTVEYTALPSLALRSLFCWLDSPESGLSSDEHYRCFFFPPRRIQSKKLMSRCFFSLRPKSCSHPTVHIVFRDSMFPIFKHIYPIGCVQDSPDPNKNSIYHNIM